MFLKYSQTLKAHSLVILLLFFTITGMLGGCASNMTGYYSDLRKSINREDYQAAADFVKKSQDEYGDKNILLYYLDYGTVLHLAGDYDQSTQNFESAKAKFDEYYTKSISAGAASMIFNDTALPYYGQDYERVYISLFEALNYILSGDDNEAAVEARQVDSLFKTFAAQNNNQNFYKDDGFIRYFMGLVYENAGYLNDAQVSYYGALKAYETGIVNIAPPQDLIDDAYTSALALHFSSRANEIKASYPQAARRVMPAGYGEVIIINYNGYIPRKVQTVMQFALFDIWPYVSQTTVDDESERRDFQTARSVSIAAFASDYVKVAFPAYQRIPNQIKYFTVDAGGDTKQSYVAQDLAELAQKVLDDEKGKIYAKTLARAAVKYVVGKVASKAVSDATGQGGLGFLTQVAFNVANSLSETADERGWNTLPENILMSRFYLPEGENNITVQFRDFNGNVVEEKNLAVNITAGKKKFVFLRSER